MEENPAWHVGILATIKTADELEARIRPLEGAGDGEP
jgi:hypothetical protein